MQKFHQSLGQITLYVSGVSAPSMAALLTVRNLNMDVKIKPLNLFAGEHRRSEFSRLNPRCCVPTLHEIDGHHGDFILWESKAIMIYLAEKCQRNDHSIYPKCSKVRAIIHQRLFHDASELYVRILDVANVAFSSNQPMITAQLKENLRKAMNVLENFLEGGQEYFAGNHVTICDFAYLASVCTLVHFGYDITMFANVNQWYRRMSTFEGFNECEKGAEEFGAMVKSKLLNTFNDTRLKYDK